MQRTIIIILVVLALLVTFVHQNADNTTVITLWFQRFKLQTSTDLLLLSSVLIGVFLGVIFSRPTIRKKNRKIREMKFTLDEFRKRERDFVENQERTHKQSQVSSKTQKSANQSEGDSENKE